MSDQAPTQEESNQSEEGGLRPPGPMTRRKFLAVIGKAAAGGLVLLEAARALPLDLHYLVPQIGNPLDFYPDRDWEKVYRDQYRYDTTFTFVCDPNDTHACRLRAYVRNGVIVRTEQAYDVGEYRDLYGNTPAACWHPRGCLKGYTLPQRIYGPYRVKYPMVRQGWKQWVEAGFPEPTDPAVHKRYFRRGEDAWVRVSWDEGFSLVATALLHIMEKYGAERGAKRLERQGYPKEMIDAMHGSGAQVVKLRGTMPLLGTTRIMAFYRFANMLALYDGQHGARGWTSFDWHGDLPPGHPMVTGVQCFDPELNDMRHSKLIVFWGKNMVENKMADAHWWIEAIERGGKVVNISPEYSPASTKADYWIPVRPGSDVALILGVANLLIQENLYDADFVKRFTDLPLLVRLDTLKLLRASEVIPGYRLAPLTGYSTTVQQIDPALREKWGDFVVWDTGAQRPVVISREDVGEHLTTNGIDPALEGTFQVTTTDETTIEVKPVFQLYKELCSEYDTDTAAEITHAPRELIRRLAHDIGTIKPVSLHTGEGINHYFHCDLTTRGVFLLMALTGNVGKQGGNVGHWAGNYKGSVLPGMPHYIAEDPFQIDGGKVKKYYKAENPAYWNYGDRPLRVNGRVLTGTSHMPTPTKAIWVGNGNHLNNAKWAYNMIANVDSRVEMIVYNEWEWTGSCEYADVVFPVHSWAELTQPEMTASCSNPFVQVWKGGIEPLYDTRMDSEVLAGVAAKLSQLTGDSRYRDYFKYILDGRTDVYIQRILDNSSTAKGYKVDEMLASERGWLLNFRTYPRIPGWEQIAESKPFYNKTGRLEFYRDEEDFITYGENLIVHREPVEATPYLPNVIVATNSAIRPDDFGISPNATSPDERAARNLKMAWAQARNTVNPLWEQGYRFYCLTPKTRHRVHSSWSVTEWNQLFESNFTDPQRRDKRMPGVGEHQIHINPDDGKELGINDGDYVWVDANPADRPYLGWKPDDLFYKVSRLKLRARYNPAYPRGVTMIKHSPFMASHKSVLAHETSQDGRARAADTGYQANLRYGSQQSLTRGWLQPTMMTDSLVRKSLYGQQIAEGYESDIHSPNTCPKETLVRIAKAEDGGQDGNSPWAPGQTGFAPGAENEDMQRYLAGGFVRLRGRK